mmetsp:Transcript_18414/g.25497  ORF Transcript_18414/g.25497 Transcript_18414/m.25497 type:complete len:128 (-) Transcript_18414:736-1119(-)
MSRIAGGELASNFEEREAPKKGLRETAHVGESILVEIYRTLDLDNVSLDFIPKNESPIVLTEQLAELREEHMFTRGLGGVLLAKIIDNFLSFSRLLPQSSEGFPELFLPDAVDVGWCEILDVQALGV